jgi:uncharacterized protein with HEPN domain
MVNPRNNRDVEWMTDMLNAIEKIERYTSGVDLDGFLADDEKQDAVLRRLEILGEATKQISEFTRNKYPEVRWRAIAGLRDVITHQYFGLSYDKIWNVVIKDIPVLKSQLNYIFDHEIKDEPK